MFSLRQLCGLASRTSPHHLTNSPLVHIAVFSQYHTNPDCPATSRHYALLAHIARTHRVTLISTAAWAKQRLSQEFAWVPAGVELRTVNVPYHNRMGPARRALAFAQYAAGAVREGLRIDKPDVIWGISTPLTAAWAAARVARWRRVPWVFEVQDLWPSFPIAMGAVPTVWARQQLFALEHRLYQSAAHVVPLSPDMARYVVGTGVAPAKVTTILNGTDFDLAARPTPSSVANLRQDYNLVGKRIVLYAGTFGRANGIPTLVAAAELLAAARPDVVWLFLGDGYYKPLLRAAANRCSAIRLIGGQPRHAVFNWFSLADVSVVSFLDLSVLDANSPAKLYDSLAVATPVVVTNRGWTKTLVEEHGCGWFVPAGQPQVLAQRLSELLADDAQQRLWDAGQRGATLAQQEFDRQKLASQMQSVLEQAAH